MCKIDLNLTIIIPYHAQKATVNFLERQLRYYETDSNYHVKVIVALSGSKALRQAVKRDIIGKSDTHFTAFELEENNMRNYASYVFKIYKALELVDTSYVTLNGADDVIFLNAIPSIITAMNNDKSISGAKGDTMFYNVKNGSVGEFSYDYHLMDNFAIERAKKVIAPSNADAIFYIVRRTVDLRQVYRKFIHIQNKYSIFSKANYNLSHLHAVDLTISGKVMIISSLPWRLQIEHNRNSTAWAGNIGLISLCFGLINREIFDDFKRDNHTLSFFKYSRYKWLWIMHNIKYTSGSLLSPIYELWHGNITMLAAMKVFGYYFSNKLYKFICQKNNVHHCSLKKGIKEYFRMHLYDSLKSNYFTKEEMLSIEKNNEVI